jgi:probable phosphoglycerate mutase
MSELLLIRHGAVSAHRGHLAAQPDLPLTDAGEEQARALRPYLCNRRFGRVLTSPLRRARQTAELAGLDAEPDEDLVEWRYAATSSRTTVGEPGPDGSWGTIWTDATGPMTASGETLHALTARAEHVLAEARSVLAREDDAVLVAHGHILRVLAARWLGLPALVASRLPLSTGSLSVLGSRRGHHALLVWNFLPRSWPPL